MEKIDFVQKVISRITLEYNTWKADLLSKDKEYIFNRNYEIHAYNEFFEYLQDDAGNEMQDRQLSENVWESLYNEGECLLQQLWDYYIDCELASTESYEEIRNLIYNYCQYFHEDIMNRKEEDNQ